MVFDFRIRPRERVSEFGIVLSAFGTLPCVFNNLVGLFCSKKSASGTLPGSSYCHSIFQQNGSFVPEFVSPRSLVFNEIGSFVPPKKISCPFVGRPSPGIQTATVTPPDRSHSPSSSSLASPNETVETSETHFFNVLVFSYLGCGKRRQIPPISKKCNFPTHFPVLKLNERLMS